MKKVRVVSEAEIQKRREKNKKIYLFGCLPIFILGVLIFLFSRSCVNDPEKKDLPTRLITMNELGDKYPFKIDSLTLVCKETGAVLVWQKNTTNVWALNGIALSFAKQNRWKSAKDEEIWNGKDLSSVLNLGLDLCK